MSKIAYHDLRQVHLDFHTPGFVKVGEDFDAKAMFDTLESSEVNALCFFATCHHGYSYFNTRTGLRHPGLSFDMFGQAAAEAAGRKVDFLSYFSLNVNEVVADRQPYCTGMERAREVAICVPAGVESNTAVAGKSAKNCDLWDTLYGAAKVCMEGHLQWDVIDPTMPLDGLACVIQTHARVDADWIDKIAAFVSNGGTLLLDAAGIMATGPVAARWLEFLGLSQSDWSPHPGSYYQVTAGELAIGLPDMAHYVHAPSVAVQTNPEADALAGTRYPPCVRSRQTFYGHFHGCDTETGGPALYEVKRGRGRVLVFTQAILAAYLQTGYHAHRTLLLNALRRAIPEPLVQTDAPTIMDAILGRKGGNLVLQVMPFVADRRHRYSFESVNETIPVGPTHLHVRVSQPCRRVRNPISGADFPHINRDGAVSFTLPPVSEHTVVLLECARIAKR